MRKNSVAALASFAALAAWITACCSGAEPTPDAKPSGGAAAVQQTAAANKHLYIFYYSKEDEMTQTARKSLEAVMAKMGDAAQWVAVQKDDPAEKALAEKLQLQTFPTPLILALAPNGAVTMVGSAVDMPEEKLRSAIAGPCEQKCLKTVQDKKVALLCAYDKNVTAEDPTVKVVSDFQAANAKRVVVIRVDPSDPAEARFLKQLGIDSKSSLTTIMLAPPKVLLGKFNGPVAKTSLVEALKSADSG
ncbi:MAG: hypothetical protein ABSE73_09520 [Planctomycetota bacterium]